MLRNDVMDINRITGLRICLKRLETGITQKELATRIGKNAATVTRYEQGVFDIPLTSLRKISTALDVSLHELIPE
jgi:transcriptional regulator with XRE-family HTH domain